MDDVTDAKEGGTTTTPAAEDFSPTARTTLRRLPKRGSFERETVYGILDEGFVCHVGFVAGGQPFVIPTAYGRKGDVCVTVTLVDGLVLARSAFHHSINYRSVVVFGRARAVESEEEKTAALEAFTEHVMPGRWADVRWPTAQELAATTVLAIQLSEVSAKVRTGPPIDDEEDYQLPVWAGVLPLGVEPGAPEADPRLPAGTPLPAYIEQFDLSERH
jgi:nitroimidazol reductase NimA-like FMN-containing flavoprotein (pyridoxamine 5'-phosphate oxidase superfamily)